MANILTTSQMLYHYRIQLSQSSTALYHGIKTMMHTIMTIMIGQFGDVCVTQIDKVMFPILTLNKIFWSFCNVAKVQQVLEFICSMAMCISQVLLVQITRNSTSRMMTCIFHKTRNSRENVQKNVQKRSEILESRH